MKDAEKWDILKKEASRKAKDELLAVILAATGLDDYIANAIAAHEAQMHD